MKTREKDDFGVVLVTCASQDQGQKLAAGIVEKRLAACVNVIASVESFFWWEGKVDRAQEVLLMIKTRRSRFAALEKYVQGQHSYQVPEIIFLKIKEGHGPYLNWIKSVCHCEGTK